MNLVHGIKENRSAHLYQFEWTIRGSLSVADRNCKIETINIFFDVGIEYLKSLDYSDKEIISYIRETLRDFKSREQK